MTPPRLEPIVSFMVVECSWCGETYGVVGTQRIGTGHDCKADRFLVAHGKPVEQQAFRCDDHLQGETIIGCQPYSKS